MLVLRQLVCAFLLAATVTPRVVYAAADYIPDDGVLQRMDHAAARRALEGWSGLTFGCFNCTYSPVGGIGVSDDGSQFLVLSPSGGKLGWVSWPALKVEVEKFAFGSEAGVRLWGNYWLWTGGNFDGAKRIADALFVLKRYAEGYEDPKVEADFQAAAKAYLENPVKPEFPATARRHRVVAEAAVREKRFEDAADGYAEALRVVPWWPEGRFNRALILGELKRYAQAALEMKRYLMLVPDAANAAAAQDKIYEWEGKAGGGK